MAAAVPLKGSYPYPVLYTKQKTKKRKAYSDGHIKVNFETGNCLLFHDNEKTTNSAPLDALLLTKPQLDQIRRGEELDIEFETHVATIQPPITEPGSTGAAGGVALPGLAKSLPKFKPPSAAVRPAPAAPEVDCNTLPRRAVTSASANRFTGGVGGGRGRYEIDEDDLDAFGDSNNHPRGGGGNFEHQKNHYARADNDGDDDDDDNDDRNKFRNGRIHTGSISAQHQDYHRNEPQQYPDLNQHQHQHQQDRENDYAMNSNHTAPFASGGAAAGAGGGAGVGAAVDKKKMWGEIFTQNMTQQQQQQQQPSQITYQLQHQQNLGEQHEPLGLPADHQHQNQQQQQQQQQQQSDHSHDQHAFSSTQVGTQANAKAVQFAEVPAEAQQEDEDKWGFF